MEDNRLLHMEKPRWRMPDPDTLARLVNVVTRSMFGIAFDVGGPQADVARYTRMAAIAIPGIYPLRVALAADDESCRALCAGLFRCAPESLEPSMLDDALCELVNMAAGQIKTAVAPEMQLTLPQLIAPPDLPALVDADVERDVVLQADRLHLLLSISRRF